MWSIFGRKDLKGKHKKIKGLKDKLYKKPKVAICSYRKQKKLRGKIILWRNLYGISPIISLYEHENSIFCEAIWHIR